MFQCKGRPVQDLVHITCESFSFSSPHYFIVQFVPSLGSRLNNEDDEDMLCTMNTNMLCTNNKVFTQTRVVTIRYLDSFFRSEGLHHAWYDDGQVLHYTLLHHKRYRGKHPIPNSKYTHLTI